MKGDSLARSIEPASLSNNRTLRAGTLCLLYFCQGFPWGFATIALLATLSAAGHDKSETATVVALSILPWTFKFFYAPLIDTYRFPSLGIRRPWIIFAQLGMAVTLLAAATSGAMESDATLQYLAWVFFVHNCFAALQDVATDSLAVDLLEDSERGRVNSLMWSSQKIGIAIGGAGMAWVIAVSSLQVAIVVMALMIVVVLCFVISVKERSTERMFPWSEGAAAKLANSGKRSVIGTFAELRRALSTRTTLMVGLCASFYVAGEGLFDPLVTETFVQELGWSAQAFSSMAGISGVIAQVFGAILGGFLSDKYGRRFMIVLGSVFVALVLATYGSTSAWWADAYYPHVILYPLFKGGIAFVAVSLFSLAMKVSWTRAAATQYTLYMALGNVGYALGAKLNGWLPGLGITMTSAEYFLLAALLSLWPLLFMAGLNPNDIVKRKRAETAA